MPAIICTQSEPPDPTAELRRSVFTSALAPPPGRGQRTVASGTRSGADLRGSSWIGMASRTARGLTFLRFFASRALPALRRRAAFFFLTLPMIVCDHAQQKSLADRNEKNSSIAFVRFVLSGGISQRIFFKSRRSHNFGSKLSVLNSFENIKTLRTERIETYTYRCRIYETWTRRRPLKTAHLPHVANIGYVHSRRA